jgi:hypothetical protein
MKLPVGDESREPGCGTLSDSSASFFKTCESDVWSLVVILLPALSTYRYFKERERELQSRVSSLEVKPATGEQ